MAAKKRGKRPGLQVRSKNGRQSKSVQKRLTTQTMRLSQDERIELYKLRENMKLALVELFDLRGKLASCRQIMEANDPMNAEMIFGPPVPSPAQAEGESPQAQPAEAPAVAEVSTDYPDEGVAP